MGDRHAAERARSWRGAPFGSLVCSSAPRAAFHPRKTKRKVALTGMTNDRNPPSLRRSQVVSRRNRIALVTMVKITSSACPHSSCAHPRDGSRRDTNKAPCPSYLFQRECVRHARGPTPMRLGTNQLTALDSTKRQRAATSQSWARRRSSAGCNPPFPPHAPRRRGVLFGDRRSHVWALNIPSLSSLLSF